MDDPIQCPEDLAIRRGLNLRHCMDCGNDFFIPAPPVPADTPWRCQDCREAIEAADEERDEADEREREDA